MSARPWPPPRVVAATHNAGKLRELERLFAPWQVEVLGAGALGVPTVDETADDYCGNAILKAEAAARWTGLPALGDDAGFEVLALPGWLGVHTARWVETQGGYPAAISSLAAKLDLSARQPRELAAKLVCSLALAQVGHPTRAVLGEAHGWLRWPPHPAPGFAALLETSEPLVQDGVLTHRRLAFAALKDALSG